MSEGGALVVQFLFFGLAALAAIGSAAVYLKTNREHGGWIFLLMAIITLNIGERIFDVSQKVLS